MPSRAPARLGRLPFRTRQYSPVTTTTIHSRHLFPSSPYISPQFPISSSRATHTSSNISSPTATKDWSSRQYLKFSTERTRAVHDLISQLPPLLAHATTPRIYDLGCGPATSTSALVSTFPSAKVTGMDSSPDMLAKARAELPSVDFVQGDVSTFTVDAGTDLIFSNAVFHWLRRAERLPTLVRFFEALKAGAVMAMQVPDNYTQASHALMRAVACQKDKPWSSAFADTRIGDLDDTKRPDLDPIEPANDFYNALAEHASNVNIWRTEYYHALKSAGEIVEWVKGTGLRPYLNAIEDEGARKAFLEEYERRLKGAYGALRDEKVLLGYPRLFVVAVRN